MARTVAIGVQDFETMITNDYFYVDKTAFIKEWWESGDSVTLIARPRRFGKTLNMSMLERFFSLKYAGKGDIFEKLSIWQDEKYREIQGTYPVISLSFAMIKEKSYELVRKKICRLLADIYNQYSFLKESKALTQKDKEEFEKISADMDDTEATLALYHLSDMLYRHYGKKVIILLDEYDTPMQEAYVDGFWDELVAFTRSLFNATFKSNPWLDKAIMTGITRVSKESIFSDLNNLEVVTTTSNKYADIFGFTQDEVFAAMDEMGYHEREKVKFWYDGFIFGDVSDIYNPWSILNYLDKGEVMTYWANTSSNSLVSKLVREGSADVKKVFEGLLAGESIRSKVDEQIVYNQLDNNESAIWSLLLASGYLKVKSKEYVGEGLEQYQEYELVITNYEVKMMFENMISDWFGRNRSDYNNFVKALLIGDLDAMNEYMNRVALNTFSSFDTGNRPSGIEPERFYHGFVLGLLVELEDRYILTSNRESGFGRYDVMLKPRKAGGEAFILEFKVFNSKRDVNLEGTVAAALKQIEDKQYEAELIAEGIPAENIRKYGFGFEGKTVLIG